MLIFEGEPLPKNHPHWKMVAEMGFELDLDRVADGYESLTHDLSEMVQTLRGIIVSMAKNPREVADNPTPYRKEIDSKLDEFRMTKNRAQAIWNPKRINPAGIMGVLTNPAVLKHLEILNAHAATMVENKALQRYIDRYELVRSHVVSLLDICETYLDPSGPLIQSTQGNLSDPEEEDVPTQS